MINWLLVCCCWWLVFVIVWSFSCPRGIYIIYRNAVCMITTIQLNTELKYYSAHLAGTAKGITNIDYICIVNRWPDNGYRRCFLRGNLMPQIQKFTWPINPHGQTFWLVSMPGYSTRSRSRVPQSTACGKRSSSRAQLSTCYLYFVYYYIFSCQNLRHASTSPTFLAKLVVAFFSRWRRYRLINSCRYQCAHHHIGRRSWCLPPASHPRGRLPRKGPARGKHLGIWYSNKYSQKASLGHT